MPRCCVPNCKVTGGHQFPRDEQLKKKWLKAIRRVKFEPKSGARVCHKHFEASDYEIIGKYTGLINQRKILKKSVIPSVFDWNVKQAQSRKENTSRKERLRTRNLGKSLRQDENSTTQDFNNIQPLEEFDDANVFQNVKITRVQSISSDLASGSREICTKGKQASNILRSFSTEQLITELLTRQQQWLRIGSSKIMVRDVKIEQ